MLNKAGPALQNDCNQLEPVEYGDLVVTSGYGLPCERVIHACTPKWQVKEESASYQVSILILQFNKISLSLSPNEMILILENYKFLRFQVAHNSE